MTSDIGLIGLAVMGENLILNMASKGFKVSVYNRTTEKVDNFLDGRVKEFKYEDSISGYHSLPNFVNSLESPRKIFVMVKAGDPVDKVIEQLIPLLEEGDIIIDGGNSNYKDTERRYELLKEKGLRYIGTGVSGGEEGALMGPSIMPGGSEDAWKYTKPILQKISAQVQDAACCEWMGNGGAGHFVKMVHNGIEYGDMQLIAESYSIMQLLRLNNEDMHKIFKDWNESELESYLIEITSDIFNKKDEEGNYVLDYIMDTAGQKGTGRWTAIESLDKGTPLTLIAEAVYARVLSSLKDQRVIASEQIKGKLINCDAIEISELKKALYASKIISYAQGFDLLKLASKEYEWDLQFGNIAKIWRGGCIIRSAFLNDINKAFQSNPDLTNLMLDPFFKEKLVESQESLRKVISFAIANGIPVPALSAALAYFDGYRTKDLPANLIQAQRDYFGAHTYERKDKPKGKFYHTNWTGKGGNTSSTQYDA